MPTIVDEIIRSQMESERRSRASAESMRTGWPTAFVRDTRDQRLRSLVSHAVEHSAWHRRRIAHVDVDRLTGDDLTALPTMTKDDVMAHWNDLVCDPALTLEDANAHLGRVAADGPGFLRGRYLVFVTGGATGTRGVFPWHWRDLLEAGLSAGRAFAALDPQRERLEAEPIRFAGVWAGSPVHGSACAGWLQEAFAGVVTQSRPASTPIRELVTWLNEYSPTQLTAYSSVLERLVIEATIGRLDINPSVVSAISEPVSDRLRRLVHDQWGVGLTNVYGAVECPSFAVSAPGETELQVVEDLAIVEPVDACHRTVQPPSQGECLLITSLCNRTMPLIRYELRDRVAFASPSRLGTAFGVRLTSPVGRTDDSFV